MIKVSITTQKGGVGKSTLTSLLANTLCFLYNAKVLIVDATPIEFGLYSNWQTESALFETIKTKKREEELLEEAEAIWAKEFAKTVLTGFKKIDVISIEDSRIKGDFRKLDTLITNYDVILYDFPRNFEDVKLLHEVLAVDYVFIPIEPDCSAGLSSSVTADILKEKNRCTKTVKAPNIYLFFNKVDVRSRQHREEILNLYKIVSQKGFKFLTKPDGTPLYIDTRVIYQNYLICSLFINVHPQIKDTKADIVLQAMVKAIKANMQKKEFNRSISDSFFRKEFPEEC